MKNNKKNNIILLNRKNNLEIINTNILYILIINKLSKTIINNFNIIIKKKRYNPINKMIEKNNKEMKEEVKCMFLFRILNNHI